MQKWELAYSYIGAWETPLIDECQFFLDDGWEPFAVDGKRAWFRRLVTKPVPVLGDREEPPPSTSGNAPFVWEGKRVY